MFTSLIYHLLNFRKLGMIGGVLAASGTALHYGVIKPNSNARRSIVTAGSSPLLGRRKATPYNYPSRGFHYVENLKSRLIVPSLEPSLKLTHLQKHTRERNKKDFSKEIQSYLSKEIKDAKFDFKDNKKDSYVLRHSEKLWINAENYSLVSDIEIPYKSIFYMKRLLNLSKEELSQDLLWSLAEESSYNKSVIRPGTIKINFDIQEPNSDINKLDQTKVYPTPARKINNFHVSFKVFNPNNSKISVFRSIFIEPLTEANVEIRLNKSELRPFSTPIRGMGYKAATWALIPDKDSFFEITLSESFPRIEHKFFSQKRLNLIHGRSKFFSELISAKESQNINDYRTINSPTYTDFTEIVTPYLVGITEDIIKKDLETWFGAVAARTLHLNIEDIKKFFNFIKSKIFFNEKGEASSIIENFASSSTWRSNFYTHLKLNEPLRKVIDQFFVETNTETKVDPKELDALLTGLNIELEKLRKEAKVTFTWVKEPELGAPPVNDNSPYPSVSFEFKQKYSWNGNGNGIDLKFKGCLVQDQVQVQDQDQCQGQKFDFSNKFQKLESILAPIKSLIGQQILGGSIDLFGTLIPDAQKFIGWEKIKIEKDESIELIFTANSSPIRPALSANFDTYDNNNVSSILGWKAMDVTTTYNMSNFHKAFASIYEKLTSQTSQTSHLKFSSLSAIPENFKKTPISLIVELVNELFKQPEKQPEKQPWPTFFQSLFQSQFKLDSTQLFVGYTRAFFNVDSWILDKTKTETETETETEYKVSPGTGTGTGTEKKDPWETELKENKFPANPKTLSLAKVLNKIHPYYSSYFPKAPINFNFTNDHKYEKFISNEGQTSIGLVHSIDKIKALLRDYYLDKNDENNSEVRSFASDKFVDWAKVKISFIRLEIEKALKSVLALKNNISGVVSIVSIVSVVSGFNLPLMLGEAIQRDAFLINVNMMLADASISLFSFPFNGHRRSAYSTHQFHVYPNLDYEKLELGSYLSKYIKPNNK